LVFLHHYNTELISRGDFELFYIDSETLNIYRVWKKDLQFSLNNFNKFKHILKHIFTIFGTHYPEDTFY